MQQTNKDHTLDSVDLLHGGEGFWKRCSLSEGRSEARVTDLLNFRCKSSISEQLLHNKLPLNLALNKLLILLIIV